MTHVYDFTNVFSASSSEWRQQQHRQQRQRHVQYLDSMDTFNWCSIVHCTDDPLGFNSLLFEFSLMQALKVLYLIHFLSSIAALYFIRTLRTEYNHFHTENHFHKISTVHVNALFAISVIDEIWPPEQSKQHEFQ